MKTQNQSSSNYLVYKVDNFVKLRRPVSPKSGAQKMDTIGKITEFDKNDKKVFFYQVYLAPSELSGGKQCHHSMHELIKTD